MASGTVREGNKKYLLGIELILRQINFFVKGFRGKKLRIQKA